MFMKFNIELNLETGDADMEMGLEQGVDPAKIDFNKVAKQINDIFIRYAPVINAVKVEKANEFKANNN